MLLYPNAKINIGLHVTARRPDGYHEIQTVFYPIGLHDRLEIERRDNFTGAELREEGNLQVDCATDDNLIVKAYRLMQEAYGIGGIRVTLSKQIPFGAGLGGGSSDAAHTAIALNKLFELGLDKEALKQIVSRLGADCAFFIENVPCYAEGIGEKLTPLTAWGIDLQDKLKDYRIEIVKPDVYVSTAAAYRGITPKQPAVSLTEALRLPVKEWREVVVNDFEETVFAHYPAIAEAKRKMYEAGAEYASMSGSGAAVFGLFRREPETGSAG